MKKQLAIYLLFIILTSCGGVQIITVNIQKPAMMPIQLDIQNITVVNNTVPQPSDIGHDAIEYSKEEKVNVSGDSLGIITVQALAQFMDEEGFFKTVSAYELVLRDDNSFLAEKPLLPAAISEIAKETDADAVISLDYLIFQSTVNTQNIGDGLTSDKLDVNIDARFRIYSGNGELLTPVVAFQDTLHWENIRQGNYSLTEDFPSRREALKLSSLHIADKMVSMFIPFWEDQYRLYYWDSSTKMRVAALHADNSEWQNAALIWGEIYEKDNNTKKKAKLAANIALANEMLDDIENALKWANISYDLFISVYKSDQNADIEYITAYKSVLEQRLKDFGELDIQGGHELPEEDE